jgi:hypothetical protein
MSVQLIALTLSAMIGTRRPSNRAAKSHGRSGRNLHLGNRKSAHSHRRASKSGRSLHHVNRRSVRNRRRANRSDRSHPLDNKRSGSSPLRVKSGSSRSGKSRTDLLRKKKRTNRRRLSA